MQLLRLVHLYPGEVMYVHGLVKIPVPVTRQNRKIIYQCFLYNTPDAIFELAATLRFRFLLFY